MIHLVRAGPVNRAVLLVDLPFHSDWHMPYLFRVACDTNIFGCYVESSAWSELRIGERLIGLRGKASRADECKYEIHKL